jgi:AraC family transcriptional regulator, ethanolamine operon transcriptional activator
MTSAPVQKTSAFATKTIRHFAATDADELCELLLDWTVELKQLQPGSFHGHATLIPLGSLLVCRTYSNQPLLEYDLPPHDCVTFCRPGRGSAPVVFLGREIQEGEAFAIGPEADTEVMCRGAHYSSTVSIKVDYLQSQSRWLSGVTSPRAGVVEVRSPGREWANAFLDTVEWIVDAARQYPASFECEEVRDSLTDALLARVDTIHAADSPVGQTRTLRAARQQAVERAREYIDANLTEPIRLSDLCRYARTQARSLEYGFREVVGVSPIAYLRATRMHRARHLLRSTAVRTRSISEIALDCGFWHLSQFAVDYKLLFSESPSVTYRRTLSQLPRQERRRATQMVAAATA